MHHTYHISTRISLSRAFISTHTVRVRLSCTGIFVGGGPDAGMISDKTQCVLIFFEP